MIVVDANILVQAIDRLEETLSGDTWVVTTRSGIVRNPLRPEQALAFVGS